LCRHALHGRGIVKGCGRLEHTDGVHSDLALIMQALLFRLSNDMPCVAREPVQYGPDAYLAQELSTKR
jgi:hypothetical protein